MKTSRGGNISAELRAFDNAKFEALFLVNESTDSVAVQRQNLGTAVRGFYSPRANEIVLIADDREALRVDESILAHELMHAWQDQTYNLTSESLSPRLRDTANARNGVVEGDAEYVRTRYEQRCQEGAWNGTCLSTEAQSGLRGGLANIGVYFLDAQPYSDGPPFVRLVHTVGGWDAVNALYDRLPASTEQVIHVDKYRSDEPETPNITDRTTEDWNRVKPPNRPDYASVGEAAIMSMFIYPHYHSQGSTQIIPPMEWLNFNEQGNVSSFDPLEYRSNYSAGWDGDRLHVYRNETNATAYVWRLAWDSPQDARQFVTGYQQVLQYWGGQQVGPQTYRITESGFADAFYVTVDGTNVTIVNAPTVEQLTEVKTDIASGTTDESVVVPERSR